MLNAGKNAYMWTVDAEDAYYRIPIHPSEYKYMGLEWANLKWLFLSLQMGMASSPKIYTRFGDAVEYIIVNNRDCNQFRRDSEQLKNNELQSYM